jgi:hypothetical protein
MIFTANFSTRIVEIFKTTVDHPAQARLVLEKLQQRFPYYRLNFDLTDCDRILRVEARLGRIDVETIRDIVKACNHDIELLT